MRNHRKHTWCNDILLSPAVTRFAYCTRLIATDASSAICFVHEFASTATSKPSGQLASVNPAYAAKGNLRDCLGHIDR